MPGYADFTAWTEVNDGKLSQTVRRASWTALRRDDDDYLYFDYGAGQIDLAWVDYFAFEVTDMNNIDGTQDLIRFHECATLPRENPAIVMKLKGRVVFDTDYTFFMSITHDGDPNISDTAELTSDTKYWATKTRSNDGKTLTIDIYDDADRTNLVDTITATNDELTDLLRYRSYTYAIDSDTHTNHESTGYLEYLYTELDSGVDEVAIEGTVVHKAMAMLIT